MKVVLTSEISPLKLGVLAWWTVGIGVLSVFLALAVHDLKTAKILPLVELDEDAIRPAPPVPVTPPAEHSKTLITGAVIFFCASIVLALAVVDYKRSWYFTSSERSWIRADVQEQEESFKRRQTALEVKHAAERQMEAELLGGGEVSVNPKSMSSSATPSPTSENLTKGDKKRSNPDLVDRWQGSFSPLTTPPAPGSVQRTLFREEHRKGYVRDPSNPNKRRKT
jgi:hypothetical protein